MVEPDYQYAGNAQYPPIAGEQDDQGRLYYPYLPNDDLRDAVNLAIALGRPLLLEGEHGCGKTQLASAIAYELTHKNQTFLAERASGAESASLHWWPYYIWNIKSTSRARDGLYTFDAVARLRDAQLLGADLRYLQDSFGEADQFWITEVMQRLKNRREYLSFGPLGSALQNDVCRPILLIDEIDKADSDFPNDLLLELEEFRFAVPETGDVFPTSRHKPIVIITSNQERPLPEAFLRRCLYFFVTFPGEARLQEIVTRRFGQLEKSQTTLVAEAIARFMDIRDCLEVQPDGRPPGTSEFLEFLTAVLQMASHTSPKTVMVSLDQLSQQLPLLGTLIKNTQDQARYQEWAKDLEYPDE